MSTPSRETLETARRLHSAAIHLLRALRRQDAASGVGPARLSALSVLVFGGPTTLHACRSRPIAKAVMADLHVVFQLKYSRFMPPHNASTRNRLRRRR